MGKRDDLVREYLVALDWRPILILAGPMDGIAKLAFEPDKDLAVFDVLWFAKSHHAELVLMRCRSDLASVGATRPNDWISMTARDLRDTVVNVAGYLGARWYSASDARAAAELAVDDILGHVDASRRDGRLCKVNAAYKIYRQAQLARGEKAISYSAHLAAFERSLVVLAAKNAQ